MTKPLDPVTFRRALEKVPGRLFSELTDRLEEYAGTFAGGTMFRQARSALAVRSGLLAGSFKKEAHGSTMDSWRLVVFTTNPYARHQEEGGSTAPVSRRYLTIPLDAAQTGGGRGAGGGAGVTRADAPRWPRSETFVSETKKGNLLIFRRTGQKRPSGWKKGDPDPSIEPLFLLVERSPRAGRMPGRLGFFAAWEREDPERREILQDAAEAALEAIGT